MTKTVRIENADSGAHFKVLIKVYEKGQNDEPDVLVFTPTVGLPD